jgi:diphthamide synthase (EF-2-diphthine--ammonia ligase)
VTETFGRVSIHGVREDLLAAQLAAARLSPVTVAIPYPCPNEAYEAALARALATAQAEGVTHIIFGDLFLHDIRAYREQRLRSTGITPVFPLWDFPTAPLARTMIAAGLAARLVCVDPRVLPAEFAGRSFDAALLDDLPAGVDPCGENGEFHTFVTAGPMLEHAIAVDLAGVVVRDGFAFADLRPPGRAPVDSTTPSNDR